MTSIIDQSFVPNERAGQFIQSENTGTGTANFSKRQGVGRHKRSL